MPDSTIGVSIVTFNSSRYIRRCLDAVLAQQGVRLDVVVVDNHSTDATREILGDYRGRVRILRNQENVGFAAAQNQAIRAVAVTATIIGAASRTMDHRPLVAPVLSPRAR